MLMLENLPIMRSFVESTESENFLGRAIGFILGIGFSEETCKALPLIILGLRKKTLHGTKEGVFLGMMSGFGFAAAEGVQYISASEGNPLQFLHRAMSGPILHAAWAGVVGWFIGAASIRQGKKWPIVVLGISCMALLHGIHDVFAGGPLILVTAAVTIITFMTYLAHGQAEGQMPPKA